MRPLDQHDEVLKETLLSAIRGWEFAPSQWEADLVTELVQLPYFDVPHLPKEELERMGMRPNECYENVRRCVRDTPGALAIDGWIIDRPDFLTHSVVFHCEQFICVTPSLLDQQKIPFIPDPKISWIEKGGKACPVRNGQIVSGPGVREFPEFTVARYSVVRGRLESGIPPEEAVEFSPEEFSSLVQSHVPAEKQGAFRMKY